jgi:hypothetical protein
LGTGPSALPLSFIIWWLKTPLDLSRRPFSTACAGVREALAAQFGNAVNSKPGKNAKSGRLLESALRVHAE